MAKGLKGINVKIDGDTTPLNKALSTVNANAKSLQTELKGVNTLLKLDPNNTEMVAQKQIILSDAIKETEEKMRLLTQAEKEMAAAGKNITDDDYRNLQREIALTATKLRDLKNEQKTFDELSKKAKTFGQSLADTAQKIPVIKNLAQAFTNVKEKISTAVKENEQIKKISQYANDAKAKVTSFAEKVPGVKKVGEAFGTVKDKVADLTTKLPSVTQALKSAGSAAASMTANVAKVGFKAMGAGAAAAGAAVVALTKKAIEGYSEYEQLVGGVETLFGASGMTLVQYAQSVNKPINEVREEYNSLMNAQQTVFDNANQAYKTAGMSANEYMETVTSVSASLIQSLDGNTEAAAEKANQAIVDMSDNANKMGSSMESIQNAYQGFAKQNYTMLDNLKLGYGGTKTEMQRLLDDAQAISGIEYDISSYADVVDAIHVIQTEMGITGTTAKEASSTIQGSVDSASAAYSNWITGMADDDADFEALTKNLVDSIMTVVDNIAPRILSTIPRIIEGLGSLVSQLATYIPGLIQQLLPTLLTGVSDLLTTLMTMLPEMLGVIAQIVPQIIAIIAQLLPQLITAGVTLLTSLLQGITDTIPMLVQTIVDLFPVIISTILVNLPQIIQAGLDMLVALINGIMQAIPQLVAMLPTIIETTVKTLISMLPQILQTGITILNSLISGILQAIPQLVAMLPTIINTTVNTLTSKLPQILQMGITILNSLINGITQAIPTLIAMLPQVITSIVNTLISNLPTIIQTGIELLGALIAGILQAIPTLIAAIPQIISAIWDTLTNVDWGSLGRNIIDGVINGVKNAASSLIQVFKDLAKSALESIKDFFGIHSPSTVMRDEVGKMIPAGMAIGVEEGMDEEEARIQEAMRKGVPTTIDSYINAKAGTARTEATTAAAGGYTQNITINSPKQLSPSEVARQTRNQTRQMVLKLQTG